MRKKERFVLGKRTFRSQKSKHFVLRIIYDENKIRDIIFNIDKELPNDLRKEYGLSSYRKELIFKLIKERILRLKNIIL